MSFLVQTVFVKDKSPMKILCYNLTIHRNHDQLTVLMLKICMVYVKIFVPEYTVDFAK